ncbi:MAG: tetraacyldisaccharide 4'-kinase, partial [Synergistaceae bacterium]|nr:tetraacyldisaccharide 4'-kinase [Synergistaceae bacterium]
ASNGYGEDAIGVILAKKLREKLPDSKISAFPLVGRGDAYTKENFEIKAALSVTPSGGVLKYSLKDLFGDMRAGLLKQVRAQLKDWQKIRTKIKTPICVGDVYLILHTLFGSGARPMFAATAKTVYLGGHWRLEKFLINRFTLKTWTRDLKSAEQLGKKAVYSGSPIMDLLCESDKEYRRGDVILLLPGSRARANRDVKLLLDAAEIINENGEKNFRMILAPTLNFEEFFASCETYGWKKNNDELIKNSVKINLSFDSVAKSVDGVKILLGLGGTANQLCAGLGIPVISIDEKGKRVQKKLLGDCEILVPADSEKLAECVLKVLRDENLYKFMSDSGRERMGTPGAIDDIVNFAIENLGWKIKNDIFFKMRN